MTAAQQPELFAFLRGLADELGAPRPHRVFLSADVNASVFYDLSIVNFIFPSQKNLVIGLGLVNVLNRSELKAVLAHEFGHFAQRSMAVGRWVYVGEQIASHMIAKRDILDRMLDFLSRIDIRVAWIGWIMRTIVWSIRAVVEAVFRWVVIAHRALSREMEFQADLVAVSATGSDALINTLYRLQSADEDWEATMDFANAQLSKGHLITDLFDLHTRVGDHLRRILNEPTRGQLPARPPSTDPASHRLFTEQIAQPPRMWSTHPPSTEREENAKRFYVAAPVDDRPSWTLFADPDSLRSAVTKFLADKIERQEGQQWETLSPQEAARELDEWYAHESYNPAYQGAYLGRYVSIAVPDAAQLYAAAPPADELAEELQQLYPVALQNAVRQWRSLQEEIGSLEAVEAGYLDAAGGVLRYRGQVIPKKQIADLIAQVKQERDRTLRNIEQHDQLCRAAHDAAAVQVAPAWQRYLQSLTRMLHYAEHSEVNLKDAHGHLANLTRMATAAGHVSAKNVRRIITAANDLQAVLARLDSQADAIQLPPRCCRSWRPNPGAP